MDISFSMYADSLTSFLTLAAQRAESGTRDVYLDKGAKEASEIYLGEMRQHFAAEGKERWRELARFTQDERRYLGFSPAHPILKRLGLLEGGLTPGAPGNLFQKTPDGYRVGYGGAFRHPGYVAPSGKRTSGARLADIARYHNSGTSKMVQRQILHAASEQTLTQMQARIREGVRLMLVTAAHDARTAGVRTHAA